MQVLRIFKNVKVKIFLYLIFKINGKILLINLENMG